MLPCARAWAGCRGGADHTAHRPRCGRGIEPWTRHHSLKKQQDKKKARQKKARQYVLPISHAVLRWFVYFLQRNVIACSRKGVLVQPGMEGGGEAGGGDTKERERERTSSSYDKRGQLALWVRRRPRMPDRGHTQARERGVLTESERGP